MKAGASLRIPSADEVFQISRYDAFSAVKQQNDEWGGPAPSPDTSYADTAAASTFDTPTETVSETPTEAVADTTYEPAPEEPETRPSLTLVPPDEEPAGIDYDDDLATAEPTSREQEIENRIAELEAADVPDQQSLIEMPLNSMARPPRSSISLETIASETPRPTPSSTDRFIPIPKTWKAGGSTGCLS